MKRKQFLLSCLIFSTLFVFTVASYPAYSANTYAASAKKNCSGNGSWVQDDDSGGHECDPGGSECNMGQSM